ncbi:MAG: hypothetical protein Q7O66_23505 [Dehalococcoidia bacterium]|nr:hypothetical protein [Dehalococcoidia bacterium]
MQELPLSLGVGSITAGKSTTGFCSMFMLRDMESFGYAVFVKPMSEELRWTRAMFSGVLSFSTLANGLISFGIGPLIDRRGALGPMIVGTIVAVGRVHCSQPGQRPLGFLPGSRHGVAIGVPCAGSLPVNVAIAN